MFGSTIHMLSYCWGSSSLEASKASAKFMVIHRRREPMTYQWLASINQNNAYSKISVIVFHHLNTYDIYIYMCVCDIIVSKSIAPAISLLEQMMPCGHKNWGIISQILWRCGYDRRSGTTCWWDGCFKPSVPFRSLFRASWSILDRLLMTYTASLGCWVALLRLHKLEIALSIPYQHIALVRFLFGLGASLLLGVNHMPVIRLFCLYLFIFSSF